MEDTEPTPLPVARVPAGPLPYPRRPRRRWGRAALVVAAVAVAAVSAWYRRPILNAAQQRLAIYRAYRAQVACESASAAVGEIVLRTDGRTTGVAGGVPYAVPAGQPLPIDKPVGRRSAAFDRYLATAVSLPSRAPWAFGDTLTLADCQAATTPAGVPVLGWVTLAQDLGDVIPVVAGVTAAASPTRPADPARLPAAAAAVSVVRVSFRPTDGPVIVRRVAAERPHDVRLRFEQSGGHTDVTAVWAGDHFTMAVDGRPTSVVEQVSLTPAVVSLPVVRSTVVAELPNVVSNVETIAADDAGVVILSDSGLAGEQRWQVHRRDWADGRVRRLIAPDRTLVGAELSPDGGRLLGRVGPKTNGGRSTCGMTIYDLRRGTRRPLDCTAIDVADGFHVTTLVDPQTAVVAGLRTPILHFNAAGRIVDQIASERADTLALGGPFLARLCWGMPGRLDVYDLTARRWSAALESPEAGDFVALSPDGRTACCGPNRWCVLDTITGDLIATLTDVDTGRGADERAVFSPDGRWLARGGCNDVILFDLHDRDHVRRVQVDTQTVYSDTLVAFTPDSGRLVLLRKDVLRTVTLASVAGVAP